MNIVKLGSVHYDAWNEFCQENTWFWHTTHWLKYLQNSKFGVEFKDHSFFMENNKEIASIVPLIQEGNELFSPGFVDDKDILAEVKRIALENGIKRIQVNADIREYLNISGYTCILDLENINSTKGHKSAIKKAERHLDYIAPLHTQYFKHDYFDIAGKVTRPHETFEILGQWISQGFGTLLEARTKSNTAGYVYILHWADRAYYFMSAVFPEYKEFNVTHYLLWQSFDILRQKGVRWLEMGEQVFNSPHCQPGEKECNISKFKRGFGGQVVVSPASEFFFDKECFKKTYEERVKKYYENTAIFPEARS